MRRTATERHRPFSERGFHRWLARHLIAGREGLLPIGDDAAAIVPPPGRVAVLKVDSLVEGTHFLRGSPPRDVGRAAVQVSLSDAAAKGSRPAAVLLALLIPPETPHRWPEEVARGAEAAARAVGALLVGGDTKSSARRAVVSTVLSWGDRRHLAPRTAARAGDWLFTTGTVGRGGAAFRDLQRSRAHPTDRVLRRLLEVRPRLHEGVGLAAVAHAMLDTSDGLAEGAWLLSGASRVRVVLEADRLPWDRTLGAPDATNPEWRRDAFYGGDYELLAAVPRADAKVAARWATRIGRIEPGRGAYLELEGQRVRLPRAGWDPFAAGAEERRRRSRRGAKH